MSDPYIDFREDIREIKSDVRRMREDLHASMIRTAVIETKLGTIGIVAGVIGAVLLEIALWAGRLFF